MVEKALPGSLPLSRGVYFNTPGVASVRWDPVAATVHVEWEGWADSTQFPILLEAGLRALTEHRGSRWLADCRRRRVIKPVDQIWSDQVFIPRLVAAGLKRFAVVLPTSGLAGTNLKASWEPWRQAGLDVGYFATVEEARKWLTEPRTRTPNDEEASSVS